MQTNSTPAPVAVPAPAQSAAGDELQKEVTLPDGTQSVWMIETDLTDRWGALNYFGVNDGRKPSLAQLEADEALLNELRAQMFDAVSFVTRKDGRFGVLIEIEYASRESEEFEICGNEDLSDYLPHAEVVAKLLAGLRVLAPRWPQVAFAVPDACYVINDRPALWAFVPSGALTPEQIETVGRAMWDDPERLFGFG